MVGVNPYPRVICTTNTQQETQNSGKGQHADRRRTLADGGEGKKKTASNHPDM